jgi:hypothetical protein
MQAGLIDQKQEAQHEDGHHNREENRKKSDLLLVSGRLALWDIFAICCHLVNASAYFGTVDLRRCPE